MTMFQGEQTADMLLRSLITTLLVATTGTAAISLGSCHCAGNSNSHSDRSRYRELDSGYPGDAPNLGRRYDLQIGRSRWC